MRRKLYHILKDTFDKTSHPKRNQFAKAKLSETLVIDHTWYLDSAAGVHTTHHLTDYLSTNLDDSQEAIETANGNILYTRGAGTIAIEVIVNGVCDFVHIHNVHYCPEIDFQSSFARYLHRQKNWKFHTNRGDPQHHRFSGGEKTITVKSAKVKIYLLLQLSAYNPQTLPVPASVDHRQKDTSSLFSQGKTTLV